MHLDEMNSNFIYNLMLICLLALIVFYSFSFVTTPNTFFLVFRELKIKISWPSKNDEEKIIAWLQELMSINHHNQLHFDQSSQQKLFIYKYFNHLIEEVMIIRKQIGVNINDALLELRTGIEKDFFYQRKMRNSFLSYLFQFLFISLIILMNCYFYQELLVITFSYWIKLICYLLPATGTIFFIFIFFKIHQYYFQHYSSLFKTLYILQLSSQTKLPLSFFSEKIKLLKMINLPQKRFARFIPRLESAFRQTTLEGKSMTKEIEFLKTELWRLWEQDFNQLNFYLDILRLIFLATILLPCFLILMYGLIEAMQIS